MFEIIYKRIKLQLSIGFLFFFIVSFLSISLTLLRVDDSHIVLIISLPVIFLITCIVIINLIGGFKDLNNWYVQILDFVYLPMSITDLDMNWTFINKSVKDIIGVTREEVLGKQCHNWNADICQTDNCGICKLRNKQGTSFFTNKGVDKNFQVDTTYLLDRKKKKIGHLEPVSDITAKVRLDEAVSQLKEYSHEKTVLKKPRVRLDDYGVDNSHMRQYTILEDSIPGEELYNLTLKANAANKAKSDFLANMSHEIRTPMNAILGFTEILKDQIQDTEQSQYLESIHTSGKSLLNLINHILDLSKVEAGKMKLEPSVVSINELLKEVQIIFAQKAKDKGLDFHFEIPENSPKSLLLDITRLKQILINLIGNAVKFTETGFVSLKVMFEYPEEINPGTVNISIVVEDSGIGIPEDHYESIFDVFSQVKDQQLTKYGGTGLGLSITKRLIEMMSGTIDVQSQIDSGSIFTINLYDIEIASTGDGDSQNRDIDYKSLDFKNSTILITDDIKVNRDLIKTYLKGYNFTYTEAENGREALDSARTIIPNLILMDMKMPVMTGYKASEILKEDASLKHIPVIALTASAMKKDEIEIQDLCDSYLKKPISKTDLIAKLMKFIPHSYNDRDKGRDVHQPKTLKKDQYVLPGSADLDFIYDLAMRGNLAGIISKANELLDQDNRYSQFAEKLKEYAGSYQDELLISFIESQKEKKHEDE